MTSSPSRMTVLAGVAALFLLGCSGSESTTDTTVTIPPADSTTTSASPTTEVSETTTTTSTPATTSTTATSTTKPPATTTTEPIGPDRHGSRRWLDRLSRGVPLRRLQPRCRRRIGSTRSDPRDEQPVVGTGLENVQTFVDNGWLARPNPDVPDTITIESDVTMIDDTTAELIACIVGAGEVYAPGASDGRIRP